MGGVASQGIDFEQGYGDDSLTGPSNDGIVVFRLVFTDGSSGVFTAATPEPTSLSLLELGAMRLLVRRKR